MMFKKYPCTIYDLKSPTFKDLPKSPLAERLRVKHLKVIIGDLPVVCDERGGGKNINVKNLTAIAANGRAMVAKSVLDTRVLVWHCGKIAITLCVCVCM